MPPKGRRPPSASGKTRDWAHPDGLPLTEIDMNAEYDGVVTNVSPFGVFVDIGAVKDGLLRVPSKLGRGLRKGMEVKNLAVLSCDPDSGRVVLQPDEASLPARPPPSAIATAPRPPSRKSQSLGPRRRTWDHSGATPLEELQEGDVFDGIVTNVSPYGVFVDIGAVRDARLSIQTKYGRRFRIGDEVHGCTLETLDLENQRCSVAVDDPEKATQDLPPKERGKPAGVAKAKAKPKANPQAKAKAKAKASQALAARPAQDMSIEDLVVGDLVDGFVTNRNQFGVFVDIGCGKDVKLQVSRSEARQFNRGDEVNGMRIETLDIEKLQITGSLDDAYLRDTEEDTQPPKTSPPVRSASLSAVPQARPKGSPKTAPKVKADVQTDWSHPDALPADQFIVGDIAEGVVTNIGSQGVFVDIGAVTDGLLKLPRSIAKQFIVGDEVNGMTVESVNTETQRIVLSLEDPLLASGGEPEAPPPVMAPTRAKRKAQPKAKTRAASASPAPKAKAKASKDWSHQDGFSVAELSVGNVVDGTVTNVVPSGVFVDIGAMKDGKLKLPRSNTRKFRKNDFIEGIIVDDIDMENELATLRLPDDMADEPEEDTQMEAVLDSNMRLPAPGSNTRSQTASRQVATQPTSASARAGSAPAAAKRAAGRPGSARPKGAAGGTRR